MTIKEREQFEEDVAVLAQDRAVLELVREFSQPSQPMPDIPRLDTSELEANVRRLKGEAQ